MKKNKRFYRIGDYKQSMCNCLNYINAFAHEQYCAEEKFICMRRCINKSTRAPSRSETNKNETKCRHFARAGLISKYTIRKQSKQNKV